MDPLTRSLMTGAAGAAGGAAYVEDVFSTWLYNGNGVSQTINNGIDLAGKGGLIWTKNRSDSFGSNLLIDTERGATSSLVTSSTSGQTVGSTHGLSFLGNGYSLSSSNTSSNASTGIYVSWTFRKAARFFDVVTWTGNGLADRQISHSLGSVPGAIIVKRTDNTGNWWVYHRSLGDDANGYSYDMLLNSTSNRTAYQVFRSSSSHTSSYFTLGSTSTIGDFNLSGATYVAYLFAHSPDIGFGDTGNQGIISCGSYTGNGSNTGPIVTLGWEPQWVLIKNASATGNWRIYDTMRGITVGYAGDADLLANSTSSETLAEAVNLTSTGFQLSNSFSDWNTSGNTYIYIAIRRGPMKRPTNAAAVFQPKLYTGTNTDNRLVVTDIVTDMAWVRRRADGTTAGMNVGDRLRGQPYLLTGATSAEVDDADSFDQQLISVTEYGNAWSAMNGFWVGNDATASINANTATDGHVALAFRRAPGFFDVVAYTGNDTTQAITHNLTVSPELVIIKSRSATGFWRTLSTSLAKYTNLNGTTAFTDASIANVFGNNTSYVAPSASSFTVGNDDSVNNVATTYVAYLFATCPGVSKVGSYTGTGTTLNIDCGFTAGARFVLIKRTDSTGDWYLWDTARGITTGNDPFRLLNAGGADDESTDYIDPLSSGFQISSTAPAAINGSGGTFLYFAIA